MVITESQPGLVASSFYQSGAKYSTVVIDRNSSGSLTWTFPNHENHPDCGSITSSMSLQSADGQHGAYYSKSLLNLQFTLDFDASRPRELQRITTIKLNYKSDF